MQRFAKPTRSSRCCASRFGRTHGNAADSRHRLLAALLALTASACAGEDPSPASTRAGKDTPVAVDAGTAVPMATEAVPIGAQGQLDRQMSVPILNFQDDDAACDDLTASGAEWAFIATTSPHAGNRVATGFHARGCANVFEAALSWRLVTGLDEPIAEGFGTATCGTGCVGTFDLVVDYPPRAEAGIAYLEVFASSAEDGRPVHVNRIPLVLE